MTIKHTEGPWIVLPAYESYIAVVGPGEPETTVCLLPLSDLFGRTIETDAEIFANACLIAEAHAMKSLAESFEIREPDADGIVWLVIQGIPGVRGSAMFNLGNRTNGLPLQVARLLEQDRRAILARIDGEDR